MKIIHIKDEYERLLRYYCKSGCLRWWLSTFSMVKQYARLLNKWMHDLPY